MVGSKQQTAFGIELLDLPLTGEEVARYEGRYTLQANGSTFKLRVFREDGQLNAELVGQGVTPLPYQGDDEFIAVVDHEIRLVFAIENSRAKSATFHMGDQVFQGEREP